jgi:putative effector of murein hydrolase LrgA (UPF0299 family)
MVARPTENLLRRRNTQACGQLDQVHRKGRRLCRKMTYLFNPYFCVINWKNKSADNFWLSFVLILPASANFSFSGSPCVLHSLRLMQVKHCINCNTHNLSLFFLVLYFIIVTKQQLSESHSGRLCKMSFIGGIACYMFRLIEPSSNNIHWW